MLVSVIHQHGSAIYRSPPFGSHCFSYFKITLKSAHGYLYRCNTTHTYTSSIHPFLVYSPMALWVIRTCRPKPQSSPTHMCPSGQHPECNSCEHRLGGGGAAGNPMRLFVLVLILRVLRLDLYHFKLFCKMHILLMN